MTRKRYEIIATCFDKKGKVISTGVNEYHRSSPLMKYFSQKAGESEHKIWRHSEFNALMKAKGKDVHSILVQRFDSTGNPAIAKPCPACQQAIKAFGVRVVRYTTEEGVKEYYNA